MKLRATEAKWKSMFEEAQADAIRFRRDRDRLLRGIQMIADSRLTVCEFAEWVQAVCEDLLDGREAQPLDDGPEVEP